MCNYIEPLASTLWFQRIAVIASGNLGGIENSLRHACHLVQLAPLSFRNILPNTIDEDAFELLLESGEFEFAARQLFGPSATLLIEASAANEPPRAVVACAELAQPVDGTGITTAAAMLNAWANWLIMVRVERGVKFDDQPAPARDWQSPDCKSACPGAS